ncbi:MAG: hypothetical protein ABI353_15465, partial [Isosphaeraceae bacterium]
WERIKEQPPQDRMRSSTERNTVSPQRRSGRDSANLIRVLERSLELDCQSDTMSLVPRWFSLSRAGDQGKGVAKDFSPDLSSDQGINPESRGPGMARPPLIVDVDCEVS